jgi:hypothetical protein
MLSPDPGHSLATRPEARPSTVSISRIERRRRVWTREMIPGAVLHTWGLDSRHNTKPALILRADRQPGVSEGRALSPSP